MNRIAPIQIRASLWAWRMGCAWMLLGVITSGLSGQETTPKSMPPDRIPDLLRPGIRPDVFYLKNEKGEEVLIPRATYEAFERSLIDASRSAVENPAGIGLSSLDLLVEPDRDYAKVKVNGRISLPTETKSWFPVPIALGQLQWIPNPDRPINNLSVSTQSNGYFWRIQPGLAQERALQLDAVCKLASSSGGFSIRLDLPPTSTVIRLKLPKGDWELSATGGGNEVVEPFRTTGDFSVATVRTTANTVTLSWNRKTEQDTLAAIEATSQTKFAPTADASLFRAVTSLSIRAPQKLGGKRFIIALPHGSQVRETTSNPIGFSGYRLVRNIAELESDQAAEKRPVELSLEIEEGMVRSEIDIPIEWQIANNSGTESILFSSPEITGVQRHTGTIECLVPRNVLFDWKPLDDTQLLRQSQANDGSDSLVYSYQFERQPAGIQSQWTSLTSRPRLTSKTSVDIQEDQVQLTGIIDFLSDPIQLPLLQLEIVGWKVERLVMRPTDYEIDPGQPLSTDRIPRYSVPINSSLWLGPTIDGRTTTQTDSVRSESMPSGGTSGAASKPTEGENANRSGTDDTPRFRLEYTLSQPIAPNAEDITWELPQLSWLTQETQQRAAKTVYGSLLVTSWPFRLLANPEQTTGMLHAPNTVSLRGAELPNDRLATRSAKPFFLSYQISDTTTAARWSGSRKRRASSTSSTYSGSAWVSRNQIELQHRWNCRSYGNRPASLRIGIPIANYPTGTPGDNSASKSSSETPDPTIAATIAQSLAPKTIFVDGIETKLESLPIDPQAISDGMVWYRWNVPLAPSDSSHTSDFLVRWNSNLSILWDNTQQFPLDLPLPIIAPEHAEDSLVIESSEFKVSHSNEVQLRATSGLVGTSTSAAEDLGEQELGSHIFPLLPSAPRWTSLLLLRGDTVSDSVRIDSEWVQTILNAIDQRDRYVVRFASNQESIEIKIPSNVRKDAKILLDGRLANVTESVDKPDSLQIELLRPPLSDRGPSQENLYVLEVFTTKPSNVGWWRRIQMSAPRLRPNDNTAPFVWQIIVPRSEHLLMTSQQLTPLYQWGWQDLFLTRTSDFSQEVMERMLGASRQAIISQQTNQYDLVSMTGAASLDSWFVPSSMIWLPVAFIVLVFSVLMNERRWLRWPWVWMLTLLGGFLFSQWAWDISIIVAQSAMAAISIAITYWLTRWLLDRRARRRSIFVSRSPSVVTATMPRTTASGSHLSLGDGLKGVDGLKGGDGPKGILSNNSPTASLGDGA
ncbi:MAG: VTT domain-containing protein [Planctomycetes bacterium]|nr:VTT domain-containing protein [Planctomycetota bacterium]